MRSFHELDEQAKLIVKTDLALNKAQEELDKRFAGLNALQKTSRLISTSQSSNVRGDPRPAARTASELDTTSVCRGPSGPLRCYTVCRRQ
jgi:hypothetical protein